MYPRSATQPSLIFNRITSLSLHKLPGGALREFKTSISTIQSLSIQSAGYASSVPIKVPSKARIGILSLDIKRQFVFCDEPVSFLLHTIFHELVFISARSLRLIGETFLQLGNAVRAVLCALSVALAILIVILCTSSEEAN